MLSPIPEKLQSTVVPLIEFSPISSIIANVKAFLTIYSPDDHSLLRHEAEKIRCYETTDLMTFLEMHEDLRQAMISARYPLI